MKTQKNHVYSNYKEVCFELGLLADDDEWRKCLNEADLQSSPKRLRRVLATITIYNRPGNVFALICDFSEQLGEDLSRDLEEYDLSVEPETFIHSVFVLMEKELENMDVSPLQIESAMGDTGLTDAQRRDVNDLFETIKEAKQ